MAVPDIHQSQFYMTIRLLVHPPQTAPIGNILFYGSRAIFSLVVLCNLFLETHSRGRPPVITIAIDFIMVGPLHCLLDSRNVPFTRGASRSWGWTTAYHSEF
jgi:hypothetical protein